MLTASLALQALLALLVSSTGLGAPSSARQLFELLHEVRRNASSEGGAAGKVHLLRIPKASSSSLSVLARRMVGCEPPGPCCRWPGDPPGTCPSRDLFACQTEGKVIGCTHHYPHYEALQRTDTPSISIMREPFRRSVSAFFYPGIHHNSKCTGSVDKCFAEYTSSPRWKNVAVKMLTGAYAYGSEPTCRTANQCKNSLELAVRNLDLLVFMGVAEMWELSLLVLHLRVPHFKPQLSDFLVAEENSSGANSSSNSSSSSSGGAGNRGSRGERTNRDVSYSAFRTQALTQPRLQTMLESQNGLDRILYEHVVQRLCEELHRLGLWRHALVRDYWRARDVKALTRAGNSSSSSSFSLPPSLSSGKNNTKNFVC